MQIDSDSRCTYVMQARGNVDQNGMHAKKLQRHWCTTLNTNTHNCYIVQMVSSFNTQTPWFDSVSVAQTRFWIVTLKMRQSEVSVSNISVMYCKCILKTIDSVSA